MQYQPKEGHMCYNCGNKASSGNYYYSDSHKLRKRWYCGFCESCLLKRGALSLSFIVVEERTFAYHTI